MGDMFSEIVIHESRVSKIQNDSDKGRRQEERAKISNKPVILP